MVLHIFDMCPAGTECVFAPKYPGQAEYSGKNSLISRNGAASICGRRVASMGPCGRDGKWSKSISRLKIHTRLKTLATGLVHKYGVCDCNDRLFVHPWDIEPV